jgi:hypothetical protein
VKLSRFKAILAAYGAAAERWPDAERAAALALSRSSVAAARALADARALDSVVYRGKPDLESNNASSLAALKARILLAARPASRGWIAGWFGVDIRPAQLWPSLVGMTAAMVIGFVAGSAGFFQVEREFDDVTMTPLAAFQVSEVDQ